MPKIALLEDNRAIAANVADYLRLEGFDVEVFHDGARGADALLRGGWDLAILDRMMPGLDGLSVGRLLKARKTGIPFIFLTAKDRASDRVQGLEIGADDYLPKPFDLDELVLRVRNVLRRNGKPAEEPGTAVRFGNVELDAAGRRATENGAAVALAPRELDIVLALARHAGTALSRHGLVREAWGDDAADADRLESSLNVQVARIRRKLPSLPLRTVPGVGYCLDKN